MDITTLLRSVEIFDGLTDGQLRKLQNFVTERTLSENEILFKINEKAEHLYIIKEGFIEIIVDDPSSSGNRVLRNLGTGQILGEMSLLEHTTRSATARAVLNNTTVLSLSFRDLSNFCEKNHKIGFRIMRNIACELSFIIRQKEQKE